MWAVWGKILYGRSCWTTWNDCKYGKETDAGNCCYWLSTGSLIIFYIFIAFFLKTPYSINQWSDYRYLRSLWSREGAEAPLFSFIFSLHYSTHPPNYTKLQSSHNLHWYMHATFTSAKNFLAFQVLPFKIRHFLPGHQEISSSLGELCKVHGRVSGTFLIGKKVLGGRKGGMHISM